tara:strand:+ start:444 stop:653 length:210 start_codon:yes stop_codon:yes gene_type:complete
MIKPGQHKELAVALIKKRGRRTKKSVANVIGITVTTLNMMENYDPNDIKIVSDITYRLASNWVNDYYVK